MQRLLAIPEYVSKFSAAFPGTPTSQLGFQHAATAIGRLRDPGRSPGPTRRSIAISSTTMRR